MASKIVKSIDFGGGFRLDITRVGIGEILKYDESGFTEAYRAIVDARIQIGHAEAILSEAGHVKRDAKYAGE